MIEAARAMTLDLIARPRRNRKSPVVRDFVRETWLGAQHFIYPLFLHDRPDDVAIRSMPGKPYAHCTARTDAFSWDSGCS